METTWNALNEIFRDVFDDQSIHLKESTSAPDIDGWDSLAHVSLIVAIEKHFKVKFKVWEIQSLKNVGEMVELISKKTSNS